MFTLKFNTKPKKGPQRESHQMQCSVDSEERMLLGERSEVNGTEVRKVSVEPYKTGTGCREGRGEGRAFGEEGNASTKSEGVCALSLFFSLSPLTPQHTNTHRGSTHTERKREADRISEHSQSALCSVHLKTYNRDV